MGHYLKPSSGKFKKDIKSQIYVDKTELIAHLNKVINTQQRYICVSRPRRFGKTMATSMLSAYYDCSRDTDELFCEFKIAKNPSYLQHKNQYDVIMINMQEFFSSSNSVEEMLDMIKRYLSSDFLKEYPNVIYYDNGNLIQMMKAYNSLNISDNSC